MDRRAVALALALALHGGCAVATPAPRRAAAVGRVAFVDHTKGYAVVDFDGRRMNVSLDAREMGAYAPGDEIRIDAAGRPLPRI
jgi:hypothetical protein